MSSKNGDNTFTKAFYILGLREGHYMKNYPFEMFILRS